MSNVAGGVPVSPDDPAFWDDWIYDDVARPTGWECATGKQRCVLAHADEQASLAEMIAYFLGEEVDGHVMVEIERRGGHAMYALRPGREWTPCSDAAAIRAAVPEFAAVVKELVAQGVVEVRRAPSEHEDFDDAAPLPAKQVDLVLTEPDSWLPGATPGMVVKVALVLGGPKRKQLSGEG